MNQYRDAFPFFAQAPQWVYLDSAATTQKPQIMIDTLQQHFVAGVANVHRAAHQLANRATSQFEAARATVAAFINAPAAANIVWTRGSTEAINLIVNSWAEANLQRGDVVMVTALEHHANLVPWQQCCQRKGAELRVLPIKDNGELDETQWDQLFDARVKVLAITAMSNVLGTVTPLTKLIARAHAVGAIVVVDAAQAIAHQIIDVQQLDCDFLVFSGHKLYGPNGIGVLYAKQALLQAMPPWQFGGEMVEHVSWQHSRFQAAPLKFEAGTPAISEAIALAASIQFLQKLDRAAIAAHEDQLLCTLENGLDSIAGVRRLSCAPQRSAIASFIIEKQHPLDIAAQLDQRHIAVRAGQLCAMPLLQRLQQPGLVRASLAVYSNTSDVQLFLRALAEIAEQDKVVVQVAPNRLIDQLHAARGWEARNRLLLQQAQTHRSWSAEERAQSIAVNGCESATWLRHQQHNEHYCFEIDSEARIVIGLGAVVLALINNKTADAILAIDIAAQFKTLGISGQLSPSRNNGVLAIIKTIREIVQSA